MRCVAGALRPLLSCRPSCREQAQSWQRGSDAGGLPGSARAVGKDQQRLLVAARPARLRPAAPLASAARGGAQKRRGARGGCGARQQPQNCWKSVEFSSVCSWAAAQRGALTSCPCPWALPLPWARAWPWARALRRAGRAQRRASPRRALQRAPSLPPSPWAQPWASRPSPWPPWAPQPSSREQPAHALRREGARAKRVSAHTLPLPAVFLGGMVAGAATI